MCQLFRKFNLEFKLFLHTVNFYTQKFSLLFFSNIDYFTIYNIKIIEVQ